MATRKKQEGEYSERLAAMLASMEAHIIADRKAFELLGNQIIEVNKDVKDLLASRSFLRGTWFAIGVFGSMIAAIAAALIAYYK